MMNQIRVGQIVRFKFGRAPVSIEHKAMAARRARNMADHMMILSENEVIVYEDLWANDRVFKVEGDYCWVGDIRDGGYRLKVTDVELIGS